MNTRQLREYRLFQQGIIRSAKRTPFEVIKNLGAMQGQDYHGSLWAIGLRTGLTQREVIKHIAQHEVIRTWPQRGTLHFVPPLDSKWMVGLSAERLVKGAQRRRERLGIDETTFHSSEKILRAAFLKNDLLSRPKILQLLEEGGISVSEGRGYHILWYLAQIGILLIAEMDGKQQQFGLLEVLFPDALNLDRLAAIKLLTKRYFISHGPATLQDFVWWSGLTMKDARFGLIENAHILRSELMSDTEYWLDKDAALPRSSKQRAYLLPGFDEYFLGYKDRHVIIDLGYMQKVVPGNNGMFKPTVVIDGKVVGTWQRSVKKDRVVITLYPFASFTDDEVTLLHVPAKQYGNFLEMPVEIVIA
ncbi:MAG TPA: winged helix DNA-binding domain-containing protein [Candidatus Microsaccharimonas sp.]|jgi:hypothetical protein